MATDWHKLRPLNGSQEKGFEELCCQLAAAEPVPGATAFVRKAAPDAGVECFWTLADGGEVGWQAKFFPSPPATGQWAQIDESVKTALAKHPRLTRYVVCLPTDRPDRRGGREKSMLDRWNERVAKWQGWAKKRKMSVRFDYWGDHELTRRLSREEHRGRHKFWFSTEQFTLAWFREALAVAIRNAHERYTPPVHVELPVAASFAALGRTPAFYQALNQRYGKLVAAAGHFVSGQQPAEFAAADAACRAAIDGISALLNPVLAGPLAAAPVLAVDPIPWEAIRALADPLAATLYEAARAVRARPQAARGEQAPAGDAVRASSRPINEALWLCGEAAAAATELGEFCGGEEATLANRPALLLTGEAGQGKTHLLCDVADRDMQQDRPRILLHGYHFTDGKPWGQVVRLLGLDCPTAEFLGALEAAGQAYRSRVVVLIDALNEGPGRATWHRHLAGMLERVASKPHIGLAVSVRSSYEELVVPPGLVPRPLTRVDHTGFSGSEYEAVHRYFAHYGVQPTLPLLVPEFSNPLFLKLFCHGVREQGWVQMPTGVRGITAILEMLLDATNGRLCKPDRMDYDKAGDPVRRATEAVVRLMAEHGTYQLPRQVVVDAVGRIHPTSGHDNSLFRNLVAEGLLTENRWRTADGYEEVVGFAYERFADHLLARHHLGAGPTAAGARRAFGRRGRLRHLVADRYQAEHHAGVIEALSVQLPERVGKELFELAPHAADFNAVRRGFVGSLVWRAAGAFADPARDRLDALIQEGWQTDDIQNALITVGPVPDHPLNADWLHTVLSRPAMAERDAWWSVFLHREWGRRRAVRQLVEWTWDAADLSGLPDGVIVLTGTTLAWCLSTANRFLRDRATKALVRLFENRVALSSRLLDRFWAVDEPYVTERLVAAAYGAAMRTPGVGGLRELALAVNDHVFRRDGLLPQLLTRDHATGIVDLARHRGAVAADECPGTTPPYRSAWPRIEVPSAEALEEIGGWREGCPRAEWALRELYSSVTGDDFSRYVIGDLSEWSSVRIGDPPSRPVRELVKAFRGRLTRGQRKQVDDFARHVEIMRLARRLDAAGHGRVFKQPFTREALEASLAEAEQAVERLLTPTPGELDFFRETAKPYFEEPHRFVRTDSFDGGLARRWMVQRVFDYGWTTGRFGEFDHEVARHRAGRSDHKAERIGKKYQWIAYRELLARLADNFYSRPERYGDTDRLEVCPAPWAVGGGFRRDLDPSVRSRGAASADAAAGRAWWSPVGYASWGGGSDAGWLRDDADLPAVGPLLSVRDAGGVDWLVLDTYVRWVSPAPPGRREYDRPQRMVWYIVRSYLVGKADAAKLFRWAARQDYMNRWMPEPGSVSSAHLSECYWSPAFQGATADADLGWRRVRERRMPCDVRVTAFNHVTEPSGLDCSMDESLRVRLPAPCIAARMNLTWHGAEGHLVDPEGRLTAMDPSVTCPGPGALLVRREAFIRYLTAENLDLVWTVLGEKQTVGGFDRNPAGWLQTSGAYRLGEHGPEGRASAQYRTSAR